MKMPLIGVFTLGYSLDHVDRLDLRIAASSGVVGRADVKVLELAGSKRNFLASLGKLQGKGLLNISESTDR